LAVGWWIAAVLLVALLIEIVICKRLRGQRWRDNAEIARLNSRLSILRQELAEVNARRKKLLAASTQALIIVEKDYQISSANKVAKRLFGKPGKTTTLMAWTRQHQLQELVDQTLQGTKMPPLYFHLDDRSLEAHARVIKEHKQPVAVALAVHDVTELQHLSRIRRDLVTNISHELRTPLASLQLLTDTLLSGALDDKEMAPHLVKKIAAQTDTLSQLAQEVLDLSMIESGRAPLRMAPCSLKGITQAQVEHLLPQAERKNLTLKIEIPDDITVLVDETMMARVTLPTWFTTPSSLPNAAA
jgi:two-component system phosphate regulon sensor histidine kinase PhoR